MSQETLAATVPTRRIARLTKASFVVMIAAVLWFGVELVLATSWQDATVYHDAGFSVAMIAVALALLGFREPGSRRGVAGMALTMASLVALFYLAVVPL